MVALRPPGKAYEIAKKVLKQQGIKLPKREVIEKVKIPVPSMQR